MQLTWKDLITTLVTAVVAFMYYTMTSHGSLPVIGSSYRWAAVVIGVLGVFLCAFGSTAVTANGISASSPLVSVAAVLGIAAFVFMLMSIATGSKLTFTILSILIVVLWFITTLRHLITR